MCLLAAGKTLSEEVCQDPLPMLATVATILVSEEEECYKQGILQECLDKAQEARNFLMEWVAAFTQIINPKALVINISSLPI